MNCCKCKEVFSDIKKLTDHLKNDHRLNKRKLQNIPIKCGVLQCVKTFQTFSGFSRHMYECLKRWPNDLTTENTKLEVSFQIIGNLSFLAFYSSYMAIITLYLL